MFILKKKKPVYLKLQERIMMNMENNGKYLKSGKKIINLTSYIDHYINSRKYNKINKYHKIQASKQVNKIVAVSIKNKYDISYVSSFFKNGTFTIIHLGLLSEEDKIVWHNEMNKIIKFYGKIAYIENDVYALVPLEVSYVEEQPKINIK